jgi:filamentous hemagglutinin
MNAQISVADRFNRQLHPEERKWIGEKEAAYAKKYGLTIEQAREELTTQAKLPVQNRSPGQWNQRASEFLGQAHGMLPPDEDSGPGYMFYATPEQRANMNMYAAYYGNGEGLNQPAPGDIARSVDRQNAYRNLYEKGTWGAAAGAATVAIAGPVAMIPGAPILSTNGALGSSALASPVGTGTISATINAGAQYVQNGSINPVDVGGAFMTGAAGSVYTGLIRNVGINNLGGATTTALNNILQGKNDSVLFGGIAAGTTSALGYGIGKGMSTAIEKSSRPTINSSSWAAPGQWAGPTGWNMLGPNNLPTIGSSAGGAFGTELGSSVINKIKEPSK